jgi:hypothetical protein
MNTFHSKSAWERINWKRAVLITALVPAVAFVLVAVTCSQPDSDLPPYPPTTTTERVCLAVLSMVVWPAFVVMKRVDSDGVGILLFLLSGVFWAVLAEVVSLARNARKA